MHRFPEIPCNVDFKYDYDCELGIFYIMHIMEMFMHIVHFSSLFLCSLNKDVLYEYLNSDDMIEQRGYVVAVATIADNQVIF